MLWIQSYNRLFIDYWHCQCGLLSNIVVEVGKSKMYKNNINCILYAHLYCLIIQFILLRKVHPKTLFLNTIQFYTIFNRLSFCIWIRTKVSQLLDVWQGSIPLIPIRLWTAFSSSGLQTPWSPR